MKEDVKKLIDELVDEIDDVTRDDLGLSAHETNLCLYGKRDSRYLNGVAAKAKKLWIPVRWFECPPPLHPDEPYLVDLESFPGGVPFTNPEHCTLDLDCVSINNDDTDSCTAEACFSILRRVCDLAGKHVCIIGRGHAVQMLASRLLYSADATVTVCHSKTENLREIVATADIIVNSAPRLNPYRDVGFRLNRVLLDISGALCDWEDSNMLTYVGPREIGRVNTAIVLNRFANV